MSKIIGNAVVKGARGKFGDDMVFRKVRGKTVIAKPPVPTEQRDPSPKQKAQTRRFQKAVRFANRMLANPDTRADYERGINGSKFTARHVAMSDYFNAPEIEAIHAERYRGAAGDQIIIEAYDDFRVVTVKVLIVDNTGKTVETGEAVNDPEDTDQWIYTAVSENTALAGSKITVQALDRPGNVAQAEVLI